MFSKQGEFKVGVNFWGSKHGIRMWREWDEESIRQDLKALSEAGIKLLRVFPDWEYFQPLERIKGYRGGHRGYSIDGGITLVNDKDENSGLNQKAFEDFGRFLTMAEEYEIDIIPSIITGWMSGRMFVPPIIDGDLITDSLSIKLQVRFIRAFVKRFRDRVCIKAWCLGNECNCLGNAERSEQAWLWTAALTDAIKALDSRPVISGMHSTKLPGEDVWTIQDQAENCDVLTTHPYACAEYNSDIDPINTYRPLMHPVANNVYIETIGGKPSIIEETGTYGEMYADEKTTADYIRCCLWSAWACDCRGYIWWIAFDQGHLSYHPFYTNNRGSNYGVLTSDRLPKPRLKELSDFQNFLKKFNRSLPRRIVDGVCVLSRGQKSWPVSYNAWLLSSQAGLDIGYCFADEPLPNANLYILPSIAEQESLRADVLKKLMDKVADGAVLYVSSGNGVLRNFSTDFGVHINTRQGYFGKKSLTFSDGVKLNIGTSFEYDLTPTDGEVLATDENGKPAFVSAQYGKGRVFWLPMPLENWLYNIPGVYHNPNAEEYSRIYKEFAKLVKTEKVAKLQSQQVTMTEHILSDNKRLLILVNCSPECRKVELVFSVKPKAVRKYHGKGEVSGENYEFTVTIEPNQPLLLEANL